VTQFTHELQWWNMYNLLNQYMDRINFVVQEELQELIDQMKEMAILDAAKARAIYESGYTSVWHISKAKPVAIMKALQKTLVVKRQYSEDLREIFL
jgi:hypothetical protein